MMLLSFIFGCEDKEIQDTDLNCAAVCMAEKTYTFTKEMSSYTLEAFVTSSYDSEEVRFEFPSSEIEYYGSSSGVIMNLSSTGFEATVEYTLDIDDIQLNGFDVSTTLSDQQEKQECGGTCTAESFTISNDDVSPLAE